MLKCSTTDVENLSKTKLPLFYKEMLCCFNECKSEINYEKRSSNDILQQPIWYNTNLKYKGNPIFFES